MDTNDKISFVDHLAELRKRLTIIAIVNLLASLLCYQYVDIIIKYILKLSKGMELIYIAPSELFIVYVKIALICGVVLASPITLLQVWLFISKGLYNKEKIYMVLSLIFGILFFALGVYFCYEVVLPTTLSFFVRITLPGIDPMISIASFVSFISTMLLCFGIVFEMPIVIFLLSLIGLVKYKFLLEKQTVIIVGIFILAAFITPPDVVSQLFLAVPMLLLFEFSIGISWLVGYFKNKKNNNI